MNHLKTMEDKIMRVKCSKQNMQQEKNSFSKEIREYECLEIDHEIAEKLGGYEHLKNIEALNVSGVSMEPLIKDSSIVFIDKSKTSLTLGSESIYVVKTSKGMVIKKVSYIPMYNKVQLISQNKLYKPELFDLEDVTIVGKVIGTSSSDYVKEVA